MYVIWLIISAYVSVSLFKLFILSINAYTLTHTLSYTHNLLAQAGSHSELMLLASQLSLRSVVMPQARVAREQQATESVCDAAVSHLSSKITLAMRSVAYCFPPLCL